jgi:Flp pilus assembly protein TadD
MSQKKTNKIERISKLIADGELDEALKSADVDDVEDLFGIGLQLNPNHAEAYDNKGIALLNNHKYDEAKAELRTAKEKAG